MSRVCYDANVLCGVCPQLLDCFVIPVVLLLSWFFLLVRYKVVHFMGVGVCLLGIGCMVGADVLVGRQQGLGKALHTNSFASSNTYTNTQTQNSRVRCVVLDAAAPA